MKPPVDAPTSRSRRRPPTSSPKCRRATSSFSPPRPTNRAVAARPVSPPRRGPPDGRRAPPRRRQPALDGPQSAPRPGSGWGPTAGAPARRRGAGACSDLARAPFFAGPRLLARDTPGCHVRSARSPAGRGFLRRRLLGPCRGASCLLARRGRASQAGVGPGAGTVAGAPPAPPVAPGLAPPPESRPRSRSARSSLVAGPELRTAGHGISRRMEVRICPVPLRPPSTRSSRRHPGPAAGWSLPSGRAGAGTRRPGPAPPRRTPRPPPGTCGTGRRQPCCMLRPPRGACKSLPEPAQGPDHQPRWAATTAARSGSTWAGGGETGRSSGAGDSREDQGEGCPDQLGERAVSVGTIPDHHARRPEPGLEGQLTTAGLVVGDRPDTDGSFAQ